MQTVYDHQLLRLRLRRLAAKDANNPLLEKIGEELSLRLLPVKRDFAKALNLFPASAEIGAALAGNKKISTLQTLNFSEAADFETLPLPEKSFDLIVSCLGLHYANDLPGVLTQLRRTLKDGGLLLGCLIGGDSLKELREAFALAEMEVAGGITPRVHPSIDVRQLGALLQRAKFDDPIIDVDKFEFKYPAALALLRDLRAWSAGNLLIERSRKFTARKILSRMADIYGKKFSDANGKIAASFDVIWFSGWAAE